MMPLRNIHLAKGGLPKPSQAGFSLLEVLIALLIAGIALGTVFQAAAEAMHSTATSARYQQAISRAVSHLDGANANLAPGEQDGDDGGGFRWHVLVRPIASTGKQDAAGKPLVGADALVVTLYAVTVSITWRENRQNRDVSLYSRRLSTSVPS